MRTATWHGFVRTSLGVDLLVLVSAEKMRVFEGQVA